MATWHWKGFEGTLSVCRRLLVAAKAHADSCFAQCFNIDLGVFLILPVSRRQPSDFLLAKSLVSRRQLSDYLLAQCEQAPADLASSCL